MAEQLEFYFPKTKSKHMAYAKMGKQYPSKGGTVRYGVQAIRDGGKSLPKYITEEEFNKYGFEYVRLDLHKNCSDLECVVNEQNGFPCVEVNNDVGKINPDYKYPQEFIDAHYHMDSNPMLTGDDSNETVELAYQAWYQKQAENEILNAEVNVGEKRVMSRKDYDIDNELSGFSNMEVGDIDLEDYQDEITESVEDEVIEAIRESVDDAMPISDGESISSSVNVDTELEITVPISGDIDYDWTANETHEDDRHDDEWNAEGLNFHGENYQNHLKVVKKAPYGGIGSLFGIGGDTEIGGFSTSELTGSSAIHGDFDSASLNYSGHQNLQVRAESFEAFSIDKDDEGKIHIENKCDGCGKEFLFTQNSNIVGGNRAGAIVYENLEGVTGHDYPEYSPYGDLLCKACWKINKEEDENADSRGQGQYGAEREDTLIKGFYCNSTEACRDTETVVRMRREDKTAKCLECDYVWKMQTIDGIRDFEEMEDSFNAEDDMVVCGGCEQERYSDSEFSIDNARSDVLDDGNVLCNYCWEKHEDYFEESDTESYSAETLCQGHQQGGSCGEKSTGECMNCFTPMCDEMRDYCDGEWVCYSCDKMGFDPDDDDDDDDYDAEMDELDDSSSIIRNQVGDMVGMVELDKNDEDIEKVDIDIIDDDGEMAYEGTLGAETFESQGKNTKMILGITALAVGLGLWKGKEIMSISDKISQSIKNMRK